MTGTIAAVSRSRTHTFTKPNADSIRLVAGLGVEGDAHQGATVKHRSRLERFGGTPNLRQVHLIDAELFDELRAAGFMVAPGQMGENVTTQGVDLLGLPVGARLASRESGDRRGDRVAQPVPPTRQAPARADGGDAGARRGGQPYSQGRDHGDRDRGWRGQGRRQGPGRAAAAAAPAARAGVRLQIPARFPRIGSTPPSVMAGLDPWAFSPRT